MKLQWSLKQSVLALAERAADALSLWYIHPTRPLLTAEEDLKREGALPEAEIGPTLGDEAEGNEKGFCDPV